MSRIALMSAVSLALLAACSDTPTDVGAPDMPVRPSFDLQSVFGKLTRPVLTAVTSPVTASPVTISWTASTHDVTGGADHFTLSHYALTVEKLVGSDYAVISTDGQNTTSTQLEVCNGQYRLEVKAIAGMTPSQTTHVALTSHNSPPSTIEFTVSGLSCDPAPSNAAPVLGVIGNWEIGEGSTLSFTASATDADAGQTLTYSLVGAPAGATIGASSGAFSWTPSDGPAQATFTVRVTDNGTPAQSDEEEITVTVNNVSPTATPNFATSVNEGDAFGLGLTSPADPSSADVSAGFSYAFDCGNGAGYGAFAGTATATCPTTNVGSRNVGAKIRDKDGGVSEYTGTVTVNDLVPSITSVTPSATLVQLVAGGGTSAVSVVFAGYGGDTFTGGINCGNGSSFTGTVQLTAYSHNCVYTAPGVYTVLATIRDEDGTGADDSKSYQYVVVYDPSAGFVTGGGWIDSPAGAYRPDAGLTGKATFGFVSRYVKGQSKPTGNTEFQFQAGSLNFKSTDYEWLVVSGARAQYKGTGAVNGVSGFKFLLTATDGQVNGGGGIDRFRIKITDASGNVVYDNIVGSTTDDLNSDTQAIAQGSIVIHSK